jgi:hypothetical protein
MHVSFLSMGCPRPYAKPRNPPEAQTLQCLA